MQHSRRVSKHYDSSLKGQLRGRRTRRDEGVRGNKGRDGGSDGWAQNWGIKGADQQKFQISSMQGNKDCGEFKKLKWVLQPRKPNHPGKRWGHTSIIHNGKLLVLGGNPGNATHEGIHRLDCGSLENVPLNYSPQLQIRESHSCILHQDCLYVYGGCINQKLTNEILQLELTGSNPTWRKVEQKNPIPPRESHVAILVQEQFMLIYGGTSEDETCYEEFWMFDLKGKNWLPVTKIQGKIDASIGVTMTPIGDFIYSFGGQWGQGDNSSYSNDLNQLCFEQEIRGPDLPPLKINLVDTSGVKPNPRTGHTAVNYKGKMLLILGGEGVSSKRASILYNDVWSFDLRTNAWSELIIENKTIFRPRTSFTANIYKNTLFVFGGFVNVNSFKCTDDLVTITLNETRQALRQELEYRSSAAAQNNHPVFCTQCKFQFVQQEKPKTPALQVVFNENYLRASSQNILYAAKFIQSPFEALGLIVDSVSRISKKIHKTFSVQIYSSKDQKNNGIQSIIDKNHLTFSVDGLNLTKNQIQALALSYCCEVQDPGFDLKNGLMRLGRQILFGQLFEDGIYYAYFFSGQGFFHSSLRIEMLNTELMKPENSILYHFLDQNGINLQDALPYQLKMHVGNLNRDKKGEPELRWIQNSLVNSQGRCFDDFMQDYFLAEKNITLKTQGKYVQLLPFEKIIRAEDIERQQEPTTGFFSKVHLIVNDIFQGNSNSQNREKYIEETSSIRLYALGRKVGIYTKPSSVSGFIELSDVSSLNYPRTRCESHEIRLALQEEIKSLLEERKKRPSSTAVFDLQQEAL